MYSVHRTPEKKAVNNTNEDKPITRSTVKNNPELREKILPGLDNVSKKRNPSKQLNLNKCTDENASSTSTDLVSGDSSFVNSQDPIKNIENFIPDKTNQIPNVNNTQKITSGNNSLIDLEESSEVKEVDNLLDFIKFTRMSKFKITDLVNESPFFNGSQKSAEEIIKYVTEVESLIANDDIPNFLKYLILRKCVESAEEWFTDKKPTTIREFITSIKNSFPTTENYYSYYNDLLTIAQKEDEDVRNYTTRLKKLVKKIKELKKLTPNLENTEYQTFETKLEADALKSFADGFKFKINVQLDKTGDFSAILNNALILEKKLNLIENQNNIQVNHCANNMMKKNIPICQICTERNHEALFCPSAACVYCKSQNHRSFDCNRATKKIKLLCNLCSNYGHSISACEFNKIGSKNCQFCQIAGHQVDQCENIKEFELCWKCFKHGHTPYLCPNKEENRENCENCKKTGHTVNECPEVICQKCNKKGHTIKNCNIQENKNRYRFCTYCENIDHELNDCIQVKTLITQQKNKNSVICQICDKSGHNAKDCFKFLNITKNKQQNTQTNTYYNKRDQNRNNVSQKICEYCNYKGHDLDMCTKYKALKNYTSNNPENCRHCNSPGHSLRNCLDLQNLQKLAGNFCSNCKNIGHTIEKCRRAQYSVEANYFSTDVESSEKINQLLNDNAENSLNDTCENLIELTDVKDYTCEENIIIPTYVVKLENLLKHIRVENVNPKNTYEFLVDSGAQLNIIKNDKVRQTDIDPRHQIMLSGISNKIMKTVGTTNILINGLFYEFHVASDAFNLPYDGILGIELLTEGKLRLDEGYLEINNVKFELLINKNRMVNEIQNKNSINDTQNLVNDSLSLQVTTSHDREKIFENENDEVMNVLKLDFNTDEINTEKDTCFTEEIKKLLNTVAEISYKNNETEPNNSKPNLRRVIETENNMQTFVAQINCALESEICQENVENKVLDYPCFLKILDNNVNFNPNENDRKHLKHNIQENNMKFEIDFNDTIEIYNVNNNNYVDKRERTQKILNKINLKHLSKKNARLIGNLIERNDDIFYCEGDKLERCTVEQHEINLTHDRPIYVKQFPLPFALRDIAIQEGKKLIENDLVRESHSPYNFPAFLVAKKGLTPENKPKHRLVIDYRELNKFTSPDPYIIPSTTEIFDEMGSAKYFITLDLISGFHQIKLRPEDTKKTAFSIHPLGRLEFKVMPFGLMNSPRTFQRIMNRVLKGLIGKICFVYIDDIIIFANTIEELIERFEIIADRLRKAHLKLESSKCNFLKTEINFLGHIISEKGIRPNESITSAVKKFKIPKTAKNIMEYLGLTNYYRKFINDYANLSKPLNDLLKKNVKFSWGIAQQEAFEKLKNALCNAPILQFPDFTKPFIISTDASNWAIAAILSQGKVPEDKPVSYASRLLKGSELRFHTYEKEALAIFWGITYFKNYVYGNKFTVYTDHKPLLKFRSADKNTRVQNWSLKLASYDFDIIYKPGSKNTNADALSRGIDDSNEIFVITRAQAKKYITPQTVNKDIYAKSEERNSRKINRQKINKKKCNDTINKNLTENIVKVKDTINLRQDNIMYFMTKSKIPLDSKTYEIVKSNNLLIDSEIQPREIEILKIKNKKLFSICLDTAKSKDLILNDISLSLKLLKNIMIQKNIATISISKDIEIINVKWEEIEQILRDIFEKSQVKVIICLNTIKYIESNHRDTIFNEMHTSPIGGHAGVHRTYLKIKNNYYWENLKRDIQKRIKNCDDCQKNKIKLRKTKQPLVITDTPLRTFDKIAMDVVGPLNVTKKDNKYILTIQDNLSKFLIVTPLKDQTAEKIADAFLKKFICIFASPKIVLSDRGQNFCSKLMKALSRRFKIKKIETTSFSPWVNGSLERQHAPLITFLRNFSNKNIEWDQFLELAQLNLNCSVNSSHKFTPYEVVFAYPPRLPSSEPLKKSEQLPTFNDYFEKLLNNMKNIANLARENLIISKHKAKKYYDKTANPVNFEVGDKVYWQKQPKPGKLEKDQNLGPFEIKNITDKGDIIFLYKGKQKQVHPNKLFLHEKKLI